MSQQQIVVSLEETRKCVMESDKIVTDFEDLPPVLEHLPTTSPESDIEHLPSVLEDLPTTSLSPPQQADIHTSDKEFNLTYDQIKLQNDYKELLKRYTNDKRKWVTERQSYVDVVNKLNENLTNVTTQLNDVNNQYEMLQRDYKTLTDMSNLHSSPTSKRQSSSSTDDSPFKRRRKVTTTSSDSEEDDDDEAASSPYEKIKELKLKLERYRSSSAPCEQCSKHKETIAQLVKNYNTARDCAAHYKNKYEKVADELKVSDQMWCSTVHKLTQNCRCQRVPYKR